MTEQEVLHLLAHEMATQQAVAHILSTAYPTDRVGISVVAEVSHRVALTLDQHSSSQ